MELCVSAVSNEHDAHLVAGSGQPGVLAVGHYLRRDLKESGPGQVELRKLQLDSEGIACRRIVGADEIRASRQRSAVPPNPDEHIHTSTEPERAGRRFADLEDANRRLDLEWNVVWRAK